MSEHRWQIDPDGNGHRARCSCGWVGHKRTYWADARREGVRHYDAIIEEPAR